VVGSETSSRSSPDRQRPSTYGPLGAGTKRSGMTAESATSGH
jgi:hypothetical protein